MTRLVRVRAVCDDCSAAPATIYCVSHGHVLCVDCDRRTHHNARLSAHQRIGLAAAITALPFCEYCDNAPATTYCETESTTLCDKCNDTVHKAAPLSHSRTPIQKTLRSRAVQFRPISTSAALPRCSANGPIQPAPSGPAIKSAHRPHVPSQSASPSKSRRHASNTNAHTSNNCYNPPRNDLKSSSAQSPRHNPSNTVHVMRQNLPHFTQLSPPPSSSPLVSITQTKNAYRRDSEQVPATSNYLELTQPSQPSDQPSRNPLFHAEDYSPFFDSHPTHSDLQLTIANPNFVPLPTEIADAAKSLCDPLIISGEPPMQPLGRDPLAEPDPNSIDLSKVVTCPSLDPDPEDCVLEEQLKPPTTTPLPTKAPSKLLKTEPHSSVDYIHGTPQPSITVMAAAATAAAERYLLETTSPASSSCERLSNPAIECGRGLDPGGVAEAATAAAESAAAAVDIGSVPARRSIVSGRHHFARLPRHASEPILPLRAAAQKHVFDEAMRRLDIAARKPRLKDEVFIPNTRRTAVVNRPNDAGAPVQELNAHEYGRRDVLMDLETPKEEFLVFDPLDLSQYDQSDPHTLEFSTIGFGTQTDSERV
ncbi:B-box zinc finger protein 19 [Gracilariopsis chorda]|uniref:B-box zinc finger protein 19 n=1 Tax=Gracilariopsis chorda TaxID=448386 RepID=A0A2V3J521_9FLOR|nr:B-box zinc finger protein 19 [Gracilariopsis chorda]|eukprot:PXF49097.1 B-box zinc finger protein 19 [Gracilariopsis chorda]